MAGCDVVRLYVLQSYRSCTFCKRKTRGETQFWIELAAPPVQNILIRSGLFHTWFTPETCLKCIQIKNFTCGTRLNMPDKNSHLFHVWKISCMKISHQIQAWNFSHQFTCENLSRIPTIPHCESTNHNCSFKTLWTNHIHQNKFDCLMK